MPEAPPPTDRPWLRRLGLLVLGIGTATGQAPLYLAWPAFGSLVLLLFWIVQAQGWRATAGRTSWAAMGYFSGALFWIVEPFLVDVARHGWMAPFALVGLAALMAIFWGLAAALAGAIGRTPAHRAVLLAVGVAAGEMARSYVFTGFPWALVSYIWI